MITAILELVGIVAVGLLIAFGLNIIVGALLFHTTKMYMQTADKIGYIVGLIAVFFWGWYCSDRIGDALVQLLGGTT